MYSPMGWFGYGTMGPAAPMPPVQGIFPFRGYMPYATLPEADSYQRSSPEEAATPKEKFSWLRAIGNFLKGGTVDVVKNMFTMPGLLMVGGTFALTVLTHGAIIPFLIPIGLSMGGYQMIKGAVTATDQFKKGQYEAGYDALAQMGMGVSTLGLSAWGIRTTYAKGTIQGKLANPKISYSQSFVEMINDIRGKNRIQGKNLAQSAWENMKDSFRNLGKRQSGSTQNLGNSLTQGMGNHVHTEHGLALPPGNNNDTDRKEPLK